MEDRDIVINTGMPGLQLLDAITRTDENGIGGGCLFSDAPPWLGVESLARLGAFHVRFLTGFGKHAFLAKIKRCLLPRREPLTGRYRLTGKLLSRSSSSFFYDLEAWNGKELEIAGQFLYAAIDYDNAFRKELLQDHYQRRFTCLTNATEKGSSREKTPDFSVRPRK
ncbi:MAG: hypothetical protein HY742_11085 [Deltaproteobacteria bacterium]|nr:hypothetical protein [Deltaproteobacteria bacterium]